MTVCCFGLVSIRFLSGFIRGRPKIIHNGSVVTRVVLIHGAATDSRIWCSTVNALKQFPHIDVFAPDRPQSGNMDTEISFLTPLCADAFIIGVSGGATLGLELATRGVPFTGALLHESAAGSLAPGLLAHVGAALAADGVEGFGRTLYGPAWTIDQTRVTLETITGEFAMFGQFEPQPLPSQSRLLQSRIVLTVGENSPPARYASVQALAEFFNVPWRVLRGVGHAAHLEGGFLHPAQSLPELFT
jgi:pimeloyl-ACP methyl ester carboxylesterase